jgi:hypothetical protein
MVEAKAIPTGTALKRAGIAFIIFGGCIYAALDPEENLLAILGPLIMAGGVLIYFRGRQQAAKALAESGPIHDSMPSLLYLRSFRTDPRTPFKILASGFTTEEEQLVGVLHSFGRLIAIGQPGERLPIPGADRIYATDSEWKEVVLEHMRSAPLVVIRAGAGAGLSWEVVQAFFTLRPKQILILVLNLSLNEYRAFVDQVRDGTNVALPTIEPCGPMRTIVDYHYDSSKALPGFITFFDDWSSTFVPLPFTVTRIGYNDLKKAFNLALRPVFERHGVEWHPVGRL